jgi:hypothetical protein
MEIMQYLIIACFVNCFKPKIYYNFFNQKPSFRNQKPLYSLSIPASDQKFVGFGKVFRNLEPTADVDLSVEACELRTNNFCCVIVQMRIVATCL